MKPGRAVVVLMSLWSVLLASSAFAQAPAAPAAAPPPSSPFDANDPEIARIKSLDWKNADFNALTLRQQCGALMAVNKGLSMLGGKADGRLDLLIAYLDKNNLGPEFEAAQSAIPEPPQVTFEDMEKLGAAFLATPQGQAKVSGQFDGMNDNMLKAYYGLYLKSAQREFAETADARHQVRAMALFLESKGKLEDFRTWSIEERKRRQQEFEQQQAAAKAQAEQAQAERREAAQAAAAERQRQQDLADQQMAAAMAQQQAQYGGEPQQQTTYTNDGWWGEPYYGWGGAYYYSNAYRGQVRDRAQNAYNRWQSSNRPTPMPAGRGGGGIRGGGRR